MKSRAQRLTNKKIAALVPGDVLYDSEVPGLHVRTFASGKRTFYLYYREKVSRKERRPKIGDVRHLSISAARLKAKEIMRAVALGLRFSGFDQIARKTYATATNDLTGAHLDPVSRAKFLWGLARKRALKKGEAFELSLGRVVAALMKGRCEKTNVEFVLDRKAARQVGLNRHPRTPSIDKVDWRRPYSDTNAQVVTLAYNLAKAQLTDGELETLCHDILSAAGWVLIAPSPQLRPAASKSGAGAENRTPVN